MKDAWDWLREEHSFQMTGLMRITHAACYATMLLYGVATITRQLFW